MGFGYGHSTSHSGTAHDRQTGERVASRFSNDMTAHVWAQRTQTFGQSGNGNFYFEGDAIYSYGSHFLVAYLLDVGSEVVALLNTASYSSTTSQHKSDARGACSQYRRFDVPNLTALRDALPVLASYAGKPGKLRREAATDDGWRAKRARDDVAKWLCSFELTEDSEVTSRDGSYSWTCEGNAEGARLIAKAAGYSPAAVREFQREHMRQRKREAEQAERAERERNLREAKHIAELSDSAFRELWPRDGDRTWPESDGWRGKPYEVKDGERFSAKLLRLQKAAKARGWTRIARELSARRKTYREHFAGRNDRITAAWRSGLAAEVRNWRDGGARPKHAKRFPLAIKRAIERSEAQERREERAAEFASWQAGEGKRPPANYYEEGTAERAAIESDEQAERERHESMFLAWQADNSQPRPPARTFLDSSRYSPKTADGRYYFNLSGEELAQYKRDNPFTDAWQLLNEAERAEERERKAAEQAERERLARLSEAEKREAWLSGSAVSWHGDDGNGGVLLRVRGDLLETSHGANVPLAHAIKAFCFVKLCRARGESWERNGRTIRVGHFQIDRIDSDGGFTAGCHRFNWPEVERVARIAGVFDSEPSAAAVEVKESDHA